MKAETLPSKPAPLIQKLPAIQRGQTNLGWLKSQHSFSFGNYFDPDRTGFRSLRVINDDVVAPGMGFGSHPHRDAEIFSYVIDGQLEHKDSLGNGSVIHAGDLQYLSAGRGITHSEFNPSKENAVHFLQIWLTPVEGGGEPRYAEKPLGRDAANGLTLLFSREPRLGSVAIRAEADIYFGRIETGERLQTPLDPGRAQWIQLIDGLIDVAGVALQPGDAVTLENVEALDVACPATAQFLLFDLA